MPVRAIGRTNSGIAFIRSAAVSLQVGSAAPDATGAAPAPATPGSTATPPAASLAPIIPAKGQREPAGAASAPFDAPAPAPLEAPAAPGAGPPAVASASAPPTLTPSDCTICVSY